MTLPNRFRVVDFLLLMVLCAASLLLIKMSFDRRYAMGPIPNAWMFIFGWSLGLSGPLYLVYRSTGKTWMASIVPAIIVGIVVVLFGLGLLIGIGQI